ncbi:A disintegrin and metalloproteinase with thrombospondin motifs 9-like isoform X3 [Montipora foliosa]
MPPTLMRGLPGEYGNASTGGKRRRRRSADENFVETLVVVDRTMVNEFGSKADLQSYILTLMGVVSQVYHDRSIGNPINIIVVKIAFLETDEPGIDVTSDATRTLKSFCRWQKKVMMKHKSHPEHHDVAILLTKTNICRSPGKCDTLGLAELGTMCNPSKSCALAEDNGLSTAYTIAHELGHVFGLPHDGDNNRCTRSRGDQHLMARSLSYDNKPWSWSNCSRDKITQFLDLGYGSCLADKPDDETKIKLQERLPGEVYSVDKQCQMVFGENSSLCPFMEPCRRLWCVKMIGHRRGCSTHHMPWADGTPCANRKWCIRGKCVKNRRLKPVDGQWGEWGPYMECTRECGGGIKHSYRQCNNPRPENGGKYCIGLRKRFKSCKTQECSKESADFRALQCANNHARTITSGSKSYRIRQWVPKYAGVRRENQCKLYCRMAGTAIYFKLKDKVIDGTPCNQDTTDICVDGKCMPAGCDRILNSDKKKDKCGVCDGDNSSCRRFSGTFNQTRFGYNYIFTIPVGSTDIVIIQYGWKNREDSSYLALQSDSEKFLLNGGMIIGLGVREFWAAGSKIWYSGSEKPIEQIKIDGKTTEPIKVHVLEVGEVVPPNIHYSLNQKVTEPEKFVYKWDHLGTWTQCSKLCKGQRKRRPRCVRAIDGQQVSNARCDQRTRPSSVTEDCNISCRLSWFIEHRGKCSARCGVGYQTRSIRCIRINIDRWGVVLEKHCPASTKPPVVVSCTGTCEGTRWNYTEWSKCSKSCNGGRQTRRAECEDDFGATLKEMDCRPSDKEPLRRPCNTFICPWWTNGTWSSCSVTCGSGQQTRELKCISERGDVTQASCDQKKKPESTRSCDMDSCPYWFAGKWTDCSQSCDSGTMTRHVMCLSGEKIAKQVDDAHCSSAARPQSRKVCKIQDCETTLYHINQEWDNGQAGYYWRISMWTPCSVSCGNKPGTQYRDVECVFVNDKQQDLVHGTFCTHTPKPAVMKECTVSMCTTWRHGSWGQCSRQCGTGVQLRVVKCTYDNFKITEEKYCDPSLKPLNERSCQIKPCIPTKGTPSQDPRSTRIIPTTTTSRQVARWHEGRWTQCSVTCGQGQRTRQVYCRFNDGKTSKECDEKKRPHTVMDCVRRACPAWHQDLWSECSASCGQGIRHRIVECRFRNGQMSQGCNEDKKPATTEECNIRPCPKWITGNWERCSVTCGSGVKKRLVECSDKDFSCNAKTKPQTAASCNLGSCPHWETSSWGECSVSCGEGIKQRSVTCKSQNGQLRTGCMEEKKPSTRQGCNVRPCPTWLIGDWERCSVTCGSGKKIRSVECSEKDLSCDARTKPQTLASCGVNPCPTWTVGPWGECPVSCGNGTTQRSVRCRLANGQISPGCDDKSKPVTMKACNIRGCPTWMTEPWSKCSVTCGSGVKQRSVECSDKDLSCDPKIKPKTTLPCNVDACPWWTVELWGECSVSCGEGIRQRNVTCVSKNGQMSPGCNKGVKPATTEVCNVRPCPYWIVGDWGMCSVSCGLGEKQRTVECSDQDFSCNVRDKPQTSARCHLEPCPQWTVGPWGECSVSCGKGISQRITSCRFQNGQLSSGCEENSKPVAKQACNVRPCPKWIAGDWVKCSVTCGSGIQIRPVQCSDKDFACDLGTKPQSTSLCNLETCPQWRTNDWSECSVTCGSGFKSRSVHCNGDVAKCDDKSRPKSVERCNPGLCPTWETGTWSKCSKTCGNGIKTRTVHCTGRQCDLKSKPAYRAVCNLGPCLEWRVGDWQQCSVSCGRGWKRRIVECTARNNRCDFRKKPDVYAICNMGRCPTWREGRWSECSVTCGNGMQTRTVECTGGEGKCNLKSKPYSTTRCNLGSCPEWNVGSWSECSVSCSTGIKKRIVKCSGRGKCDAETQPEAVTSCSLGPCPEWNVRDWSQCSVSCGAGTRTRVVSCTGVANKCDPESKPVSVIQCSLASCPVWQTGRWSECSATCGEGMKQRDVMCSRSDVSCDAGSKPASTTDCIVNACPVWEAGEWGQCSVTCGDGLQTRTVKCSEGLDKCDPKTRPDISANCNTGSCPQWSVGLWSQCSSSCGEGIKERLVECLRGNETSSACNPSSMPAKRVSCNKGKCPFWNIGKWSECSVTCGKGTKQRQVQCISGVSTSCNETNQPTVTDECNLGPCPSWNTGRWTRCSRTCGVGVKRRAVACFSMVTGKRLHDSACDVKRRPAEQEDCGIKECFPEAKWHKGVWSKCSVYCGIGEKSRDVWCSAKNGDKILDKYCAGERKPKTKRSCNKKRRCGEWEVGLWGECSVTCGKGTRDRVIRCFHNHEYRDDTFCDHNTRPLDKQPCTVRGCSLYSNQYKWQTSTWTKCSSSCGSGKKSRDVWCVDSSNRKVPDTLCSPFSKPDNSSLCDGFQCPSKWKHGDWSRCSKSCGLGIQLRIVECVGNTECEERMKPPLWRLCNMGRCKGFLFWRVGPWSPHCSVSCGRGIVRRAVKCLARNGTFVDDVHCTTPSSSKPDTSRVCQMEPCPPTTCKEVQAIGGLQSDGEQNLLVQGKNLQVYCHQMMSDKPTEYITLKTGPSENFAEIYPKRLRNAWECPRNGSHTETCNCEDEHYKLSGGSYFSKVRLDLSSMRIIAEDKTFASLRGLSPPPYGTAGDCYSAQGNCPQGRFSINLRETGIRLSSKVTWSSTGQAYSQIIYRYPEGLQVIGKCGGRCATCTSELGGGLQIELVKDESWSL